MPQTLISPGPDGSESTFERATQAAEAIFRETGALPTTEAVFERIGVHNMPAIRKAIRAWMVDLPGRLYRAEAVPDLPVSIQGAVKSLWEGAVAAADAAYADERKTLKGQISALEARVAELEHAVAAAEAGTVELEQALHAAETRESGLSQGLQEARSRIDAGHLEMARLRDQAETAIAARREAEEEVRKGQTYLQEQMKWLHGKLEEARADAEARIAKAATMNREQLAHLKVEVEKRELWNQQLREQAAEARGEVKALASSLTTANRRVDDCLKELDERSTALQALNRQLAGKEAEIRAQEQALAELTKELEAVKSAASAKDAAEERRQREQPADDLPEAPSPDG